MAFVYENDSVISFAEMQDVLDRDHRLFDNNEGLSDNVIEPLLTRATERILTKIKLTEFWKSYYPSGTQNVDPDLIIARHNDFTDLCVYEALSEYVLPIIADFGDEDNAERKKMGYYKQRADALFGELINSGDWYDFDADGSIGTNEIKRDTYSLKRIR